MKSAFSHAYLHVQTQIWWMCKYRGWLKKYRKEKGGHSCLLLFQKVLCQSQLSFINTFNCKRIIKTTNFKVHSTGKPPYSLWIKEKINTTHFVKPLGLPLDCRSPERFIHLGPESKANWSQWESSMGFALGLFTAMLQCGYQKIVAFFLDYFPFKCGKYTSVTLTNINENHGCGLTSFHANGSHRQWPIYM